MPNIVVALRETVYPHIRAHRGFFRDPDLLPLLTQEYAYMDRDLAETDPFFKQLIPYVVIQTPLGVLLYQRTKKAGEQRLAGALSIGFGGHIEEPEDLFTGLHREVFSEELVWPDDDQTSAKLEHLGFVYFNEGVHEVHLGVVFIIHTNTTNLTSKDESIKLLGFQKLSALALHFPSLELWSQAVFAELAKDLKYR
jgi:predicted NUDIX family phosphoesterase